MIGFVSQFTNRIVEFLDHLGEPIQNHHHLEETFATLDKGFRTRAAEDLATPSPDLAAASDPDKDFRSSPEAADEAYSHYRGIIKDRNS